MAYSYPGLQTITISEKRAWPLPTLAATTASAAAAVLIVPSSFKGLLAALTRMIFH